MNLAESVFVQKVIDNKSGNFLLKAVRVMVLFKKVFGERRIPVLAQSLAYTTIFTLVPILAAFFSVLGIVTSNQMVETKIRDTIATYFFPEYVNTIFDQFEKLTAASTFFGVVGFPTLFLAGVFLYVKVYASINEIWLSEKKSMWFKNIMSFFMTLFLGPMILVLVFSLPPYLQTIPYYRAVLSFAYVETVFTQLIPIAIIFFGLLTLYLYIPSITVRYLAAVRGALIAALVIQGSNYLVSFYLKSFSKLDVFYGSLAMFPIFLLWVYIIWMVVLSGAALTFIFHYHSNTGYKDVKGMYNDESLLCSSLQVMMYLVQSFQEKGRAPVFDRIQLMLGLNRHRLSHILNTLIAEKLVITYDEAYSRRRTLTRYQLGMSPDKITIISLIPLFYSPKDHIVFDEKLNELIKFLDIHPGFLMEKVTLQDLLNDPESMLSKVKSVIKGMENPPAVLQPETNGT